ncbi:hypothetical protein X946_4566 [Burkholderia sp. ABCPW 111]|nr:hypothetical protein X946_4566 [Burkholderia sp. ABCPW 111]
MCPANKAPAITRSASRGSFGNVFIFVSSWCGPHGASPGREARLRRGRAVVLRMRQGGVGVYVYGTVQAPSATMRVPLISAKWTM